MKYKDKDRITTRQTKVTNLIMQTNFNNLNPWLVDISERLYAVIL